MVAVPGIGSQKIYVSLTLGNQRAGCDAWYSVGSLDLVRSVWIIVNYDDEEC